LVVTPAEAVLSDEVQEWAADFLSDALTNNKVTKCLFESSPPVQHLVAQPDCGPLHIAAFAYSQTGSKEGAVVTFSLLADAVYFKPRWR
jgi:hypothetical protein